MEVEKEQPVSSLNASSPECELSATRWVHAGEHRVRQEVQAQAEEQLPQAHKSYSVS